jgi:molybdenum cofactor sulfurtransferase
VPCTLARCPPSPGNRIGRLRRPRGHNATGSNSTSNINNQAGKSILLSNESPILLISRSSINRLNEDIKAASSIGRAVSADSFRGNIVVAEGGATKISESPYIEESWQSLHIGEENNTFEVMGPCQRCQMVCIDQKSAQKRQEPFSTLAKTRRRDGKVWFGVHLCLVQAHNRANVTTEKRGVRWTLEESTWLRVGDRVVIDC